MKTTALPLREIPRRWKWHHGALLRKRDALLRARDERHAALRDLAAEQESDRTDVATEEVERRNVMAELVQEEKELAEVEAALARLADGSYGACEMTGEPIAAARLRAVPWTRFSKEAGTRCERAAGKS
jgi:DnaK suppressor protein